MLRTATLIGSAQPGGDPDLPVRRGQRVGQTEFAQHLGYPQDQYCLGFLRAQRTEREPVTVQEPAAAARPGLRQYRKPAALSEARSR